MDMPKIEYTPEQDEDDGDGDSDGNALIEDFEGELIDELSNEDDEDQKSP